jgi:replicative DNA helicase
MSEQPHSDELEIALLSALMQDQSAFLALTASVQPDTFYRDKNRLVFNAAVRCSHRVAACDVQILGEELNRQGKLMEVGGAYLADLVAAPSSPNWQHYRRILEEKARRRRIIDAAERILTMGFDENYTTDEYATRSEGTLFQSLSIAQSDTLLTPQDLAATLDQVPGEGGLPMGFRLLDDPVPTLSPGRLVILAGRPSLGKTAFVCGILRQIALGCPALPCLFFSCEQTGREIVDRILALRTGRTLYDIKTGSLRSDDVEHIANSGLYLSEAGSPTIATVVSQIRAAKAAYGIRLVVLDHIGHVVGGRKENRNLEVGDVARTLKATAKDLKIPIVAVCQLNRLVESRNVKRPQLSDLRESGEIEQEADTVVFLWTKEENIHQAELPEILSVAKQRDGETGDIRVVFRKPYMRFTDDQGTDVDDWPYSAQSDRAAGEDF